MHWGNIVFIDHVFTSLSTQLYVTGCIETLKYVCTPWSESVEELAQTCLKMDHPQVVMLDKQYQLLQLKKLMSEYGIKNVNFSDTSSYVSIVSYCLLVVVFSLL